VWITGVGWHISTRERYRESRRREKQQTRERRQNVIVANKRNIKKEKEGERMKQSLTDSTAE
jgi:hypothetical protein